MEIDCKKIVVAAVHPSRTTNRKTGNKHYSKST